jgi:hypothetical protein
VILADSLARLDFPDSGAALLTEAAVVRRRQE